MSYVDGFVVPVPKRKRAAYTAMARKASRVCKDHGALDYHECLASMMDVNKLPFDAKRMIFGGFKAILSL